MKLHYSQTRGPFCLNERSFTTLRNYTILKREFGVNAEFLSFTTLWNYTILKRGLCRLLLILGFTALWNYTILKLVNYARIYTCSFTALWNYTILKLFQKIQELTQVLLPYEITLFSNSNFSQRQGNVVLLPYKITLFSNQWGQGTK